MLHLKPTRVLQLVILSLLSAVRVLSADVVTLTDGSRLVGTIKGLSQGKLTLETDFAGTLELDASKIDSIEAVEPVNVALASGDRFVGTVQPNPQGEGFVVKSKYADIPVRAADVQAIWPKGEPSPEQREQEAAAAQRDEELWSASLEAGGVLKEGNTDTLDGHFRLELRRKTESDLLRFYARGDYGETDDVRNTSEVKGGFDYELDLGKRFSWYAGIELENDEFENLDLRSTVKTGLGYHWVKKEKFDLKTRAGFGYVHESFKNGMTDDKAVLDLGLFLRWDIATWAQLTHDASYQPSFDDSADYRMVFDSAVTMPLGDSDVWKFKVGMTNQYDSMPEPGVERLDNTYYSAIVFEIK